MSYSVTNLKQEIEAMAHGTTTDKINNINGMIYRAARQVLLDIDPQETKRITPFTSSIYSQIYNYATPVDLKGNRIIDIFPQVNRLTTDLITQTYNQNFDINKAVTSTSNFSILMNSGIKTIEINDVNLPVPVVIDTADSITTWTAVPSVTSLSVDNVNYASGSGSIKFNMDGTSATGGLQDILVTPLDLSAHQQQSLISFLIYLPKASAVTSLQMRLNMTFNGAAIGDWISPLITTTQSGTALQDGWNQCSFLWSTCTASTPFVAAVTPSDARVSGVLLTINTDGTAQTGMRLDNILSTMGLILNIEYYSKYLFKDAVSGAWQETITDDSNIINLDTESYNLLLYQTCIQMGQQIQGLDAMFYDGNFFQNKYEQSKDRYWALYKTEVQKPSLQYYRTDRPGWTKYVGRRFNY